MLTLNTTRSKVSRFFQALDSRTVVQIAALAFLCAFALGGAIPAHAQSIGIEFGQEDLDIFFDWFNTIFNALLPIALLGAGLTAGGIFVWVIGGMLVKAFRSMTGVGSA